MPRKTGALRDQHTGLGMETLGAIVDIEPTPVGLGNRRVSAPRAATSLKVKPAYTAYYGQPQPCSEGQRMQHDFELGRIGAKEGHTTHATYARRYNGEVALMCGPCATSWRKADGWTTALPTRHAPAPRKSTAKSVIPKQRKARTSK